MVKTARSKCRAFRVKKDVKYTLREKASCPVKVSKEEEKEIVGNL